MPSNNSLTELNIFASKVGDSFLILFLRELNKNEIITPISIEVIAGNDFVAVL